MDGSGTRNRVRLGQCGSSDHARVWLCCDLLDGPKGIIISFGPNLLLSDQVLQIQRETGFPSISMVSIDLPPVPINLRRRLLQRIQSCLDYVCGLYDVVEPVPALYSFIDQNRRGLKELDVAGKHHARPIAVEPCSLDLSPRPSDVLVDVVADGRPAIKEEFAAETREPRGRRAPSLGCHGTHHPSAQGEAQEHHPLVALQGSLQQA